MFKKGNIVLMKQVRFSNGFEGPGVLKLMRETCSFHPALIACQNYSMVKSYVSKTYTGKTTD